MRARAGGARRASVATSAGASAARAGEGSGGEPAPDLIAVTVPAADDVCMIDDVDDIVSEDVAVTVLVADNVCVIDDADDVVSEDVAVAVAVTVLVADVCVIDDVDDVVCVGVSQGFTAVRGVAVVMSPSATG